MKEFNKLVRDKIPEIMQNDGEIPVFHTLSDEDYKKELDKKLQEEVQEYLKDDNGEELADIVEVIEAILKFKNISLEEFKSIKNDKRNRKGSFDKKVFLEKTLNKEKEFER